MSQIICQNCQTLNPPEMKFCSNCGQILAHSGADHKPESDAADLPPTMLSYSPPGFTPPTSPSVSPKSFAPPDSVPTFTAPAVTAPMFKTPTPPPPKSNKGILFGLLGCGGLLFVSLLGLLIGIPVLQKAGVLPQPLFGKATPTPTPYDWGNNSNPPVNRNGNTVVNSPTPPLTGGDGAADLLSKWQAVKQVGDFKQTDAKIVNAKEYFPLATDAIQVTYYNGSKYVFLTIGKFVSSTVASSNYDDQITSVKNGGGTILSNNTDSQGKAASYKYKDYYFIETCYNNADNRAHSSDAQALASFWKGIVQLANPASTTPSSSDSTNLVGVWKGTFDGAGVTFNISNQTGQTFSGTLQSASGAVVQIEGQINPSTRAMTIKETKVVTNAKSGPWSLGNDSGTLSTDGKSMSGSGNDGVHQPYTWTVTKQ